MLPSGFAPALPKSDRPQTQALDRAVATGIGVLIISRFYCKNIKTDTVYSSVWTEHNSILTHCGRMMQIWVCNTVKLGTSASSP